MSGRGIPDNKLKAFSIGSMGKRTLTKKEQEELKRKEDEEAVGKVYAEFVDTFNNTDKTSKTWVKAGTFTAGSRSEDVSDKGKLYKPQSQYKSDEPKPPKEKPEPSKSDRRPDKLGKKKVTEKKKTNLELFKEELKARQEEREERYRIKTMMRSGDGRDGDGERKFSSTSAALAESGTGSHDTGDPNTTNLYLANLSPRLTEQQLMELFGKFGPLASIKIMWPRTEDEKSRGKNCGFVAYMSRKDGDRALDALLGKDIDGFEMRMGWGKPVPIPLHPIYIPPSLLKFTLPPPPSGLPFNSQPENKKEADRFGVGKTDHIRPLKGDENENEIFNKMLYRAVVKVAIPTDRTQLCLINRLIEFVVREGPMFEAMIMNREMNNRAFQFLFDNQSPEHVYYRWRLFTLLQGDTRERWVTDEFRMFKGGSLWKPPTMNLYTNGMPEEVLEAESKEKDRSLRPRDSSDDKKSSSSAGDAAEAAADNAGSGKSRSAGGGGNSSASAGRGKDGKGLSDSQRDRFEDMLRNLIPDRNPVAEAMVWCIEHADAGVEIVDCIAESLSILQTPIMKKIARLYLISDILHNCTVKGITNVSFFRKGFQSKLPDIFGDLYECHKNIDSKLKAEAFKQRVMLCFRAWEDWALYPSDFLIKLQNIFIGLTGESIGGGDDKEAILAADDGSAGAGATPTRVDDPRHMQSDPADAVKLVSDDDEDVDGVPLDGAAMLKAAQKSGRRPTRDSDSDLDGAPLEQDAAAAAASTAERLAAAAGGKATKANLPTGFVPSKWETVDPEEVQAQAVTSKWEHFDRDEDRTEEDDDDVDGLPLQLDARATEDRRARLREIELKVMCFQDELEAGRIAAKPGWTVSEQIEHFRKKLVKQANKELSAKDLEKARSALSAAPAEAAAAASAAAPQTPQAEKRSGSGGGGGDGASSLGALARAYSDEEDTDDRSRTKGRSTKKKKSRRNRRSSSSSRSRSRSRSRSKERRKSSSSHSRSKRRSRSSSSSPERSSRSSRRSPKRSNRSRSRSPSKKKHKKKRH